MMKSKWLRVLIGCCCISLLMVGYAQLNNPQIESASEAVFIIFGCTLAFYIWYGIFVLIGKAAKKKSTAEPRQIVLAAIIDVQYKTKVKTNFPKALALSMLGKRAYGQIGGIIGAAAGNSVETIPKKVLFAILYSDGTQRIEWVKYGSMRYRFLMPYVE